MKPGRCVILAAMTDYTPSSEPSYSETIPAWSVHLVTASGAILGLLALVAITNHQWILAFVWMAACLLIDSVDGTLARLMRVKYVLPTFDGALLDNMVDYFTYVIVPAFFLYEANLLPGMLATTVTAGLIILASGYQFCQSDAKTEDHYFKGFPSYWNIVVFYLFLLEMNIWVNLAILLFLCALVFIPIKYVYPSRSPQYQFLTLALAGVWGALCSVTLATYPRHNPLLIWASLLFVVYYVGISLHLMMRSSTPGERS